MLTDNEARTEMSAPNIRRTIAVARLCDELGHAGDTLSALRQMQRMATALKVIHTWAQFPPLDTRAVKALCEDALKIQPVP